MSHGMHIKLHLYGVAFEALKDSSKAERFLMEGVKAAGMRPLDGPWVYDIRKQLELQGQQPYPDEPEGVTGVVVLSTSHVAIHTNPHRGHAIIDCYSCRDFYPTAVVEVARQEYRFQHHQVFDLSYALDLPPVQYDAEGRSCVG